MPSFRRSLPVLVGAGVVLAGVVLTPTAAQAATVSIPVDEGQLENVWIEYGDLTLGADVEYLRPILPAEVTELDTALNWSFSAGATLLTGSIPDTATPIEVALPAELEPETTAYFSIGTGFQVRPGVVLQVQFAIEEGGAEEFAPDLALANASSINQYDPNDPGFAFSRSFVATEDTQVAWGDTLVFPAPAGTWTGTPESWVNTQKQAFLYPADFHPERGIEVDLQSTIVISESGDSLSVTLPATAPPGYNWSSGTTLFIQIIEEWETPFGPDTGGSYLAEIGLNFFPTSRIAGFDRYDTAARVAQEFDTADYVYIANGLNFPDALGAAPAAAFRDAPLLTTAPTSLHWAPREQLMRLQPGHIIIAGGPGSVSVEVEAEIEALYPGTQVQRIAGVDRYDTSRKIVEDIYGSGVTAADAFFATGANFPDALASSAAAAHLGAPVILVPGAAASVDDVTLDLATEEVGATQAYIAGGEGTVSAGIESTLEGRFGAGNVDRRAGIDRYSTSVAINELFDTSDTVYLATGAGYADALAGAALAGVKDAPLFTVPATCVPQAVLDAIDDLGATNIVLLGGIGTLSPAVGNLTPCP